MSVKDILKKYQIWFIYLFFNLTFYLVLFDFSTLAVERYFMFLIIKRCPGSTGKSGLLLGMTVWCVPSQGPVKGPIFRRRQWL